MPVLKKIAARLPQQWQTDLRRMNYARLIRQNRFFSDELEFGLLGELIRPGDWVIDIGANVGHYSKRFSELVGAEGRVIAFEPVPTTFSLLAANAHRFSHRNVTLINAAISSKFDVVGMSMPNFDTGLANYYEARISSASEGAVSALAMSVDALGIDRPVALVKIDVEGHEAQALAGMRKLIEDWHPILIVETESDEVIAGLASMGYRADRLQGSHNVVFQPSV